MIPVNQFEPKTIRPRAFYVRMVTSLVPVMGLYGLMSYDALKLFDFLRYFFGLSRNWALVASAPAALVIAFAVYMLSQMMREWIWDTVYIIVGTVRFQGKEGGKIPAGLRLSNGDGQEYITISDSVIGKEGIADVEICVRWRDRATP